MATDNGGGSTFGGRIADRLTDSVVRGKAAITERLAPHWVRVGMGIQDEFFRLTGAEVKNTVGPLWCMIADAPDAPEWLRRTGEFVGRGHGQWQTLLAGTASGAAMGGGLLDLVRNEMAPMIGRLIGSNPNLWLSPTEAAAADVRNLGRGMDWFGIAARSGLDSEHFRVLRALNTTVLGPNEIVELYRRGNLEAQAAVDALERTGFELGQANHLLSLARTYIPLPDAAQMWGRDAITTEELRQLAAIGGFTEKDADRYSELAGEPPAPELLYGAFRRGFINAARLRRGIVQGPIRNEWIDVLEEMAYHSMTPDAAAAAVTQGHMSIEDGEKIGREYGLTPGQFSILVDTSGRPPGLDFAAEAFLRGFLTEAEWEAMFLESSIKNKYIPVMRKMRTRLMPRETATMLLTRGVISEQRCADILRQLGYDADDVEAFIAAATTDRGQPQRDLTLATTRSLFVEYEISEEQATAMLQALGYDDNEVALELTLGMLARERTARNAAITRIRSGFVRGLLSDQDASNAMDALGVRPERRDALLGIWAIEQQTVTRDLTPAQLVSAAKKGIMAPTDALQRLVGQGYAVDDAATLLAISGVNPT